MRKLRLTQKKSTKSFCVIAPATPHTEEMVGLLSSVQYCKLKNYDAQNLIAIQSLGHNPPDRTEINENEN